jgi:glycosyltransferase involved in cell wall biosynthesis
MIITVSSKVRDELYKLLLLPQTRKKIVTIPIGIDIGRYRKYYRRLDERELAVLHMGTRRQKNLRCTLQAMRLLWREGIRVSLYITGHESPYLRYFLNSLSAEERSLVKYVGVLERDRLIDLICRVRAEILPSYYEAFSISTLESMACGTPVVVSDTIPRELVKHGVNGFRVKDADDFRTFAQYAKDLLLNDDLWMKMSDVSLRISKLFDVDIMVDRILSIYRNL